MTAPLFVALALADPPVVVAQMTVQGGLAIDGSGVGTDADGGDDWFAGPGFALMIPNSATITTVWLMLTSKNEGFTGTEASSVRVNGVGLGPALLVGEGTRYAVYQLDPVQYSISADRDVGYEESSAVEDSFDEGMGVLGATLAVMYEDTTRPAHRQVTLLASYGSSAGTEYSIGSLETAHPGPDMVLATGIAWECADEQDGVISVNGASVAGEVGGRDDGDAPWLSCKGDWNSLWTVGSFGADPTGILVGADGDDPDAEPNDGLPDNSRQSDELWRIPYDGSGRFGLGYSSPSADAWLGVIAVSIDLDQDSDGLVDAVDPCTDADHDGFGHPDYPSECELDCDDGDSAIGAPAGYADVDGDGFGSSTDYACEPREGYVDDNQDCDDTDTAVSPAGVEVCDAAARDDDCDGLVNDDDPDVMGTTAWFPDYDGDGYGSAKDGDFACVNPLDHVAEGTDCDDANATIFPGAPEFGGDGIDQDCDGGDLAGVVADPAADAGVCGEGCGCVGVRAPGLDALLLMVGWFWVRLRRVSLRLGRR